MKILLTGASSYVGARLYFDLSKKFDVTGTYSSHQLSKKFIHLDVTDKSEVIKVVGDVKPDVIIHAANNASAKWCDANPKEAEAINHFSTGYIVDAATGVGARVIYISSLSALDRTNVYGKTKYESEQLVKKVNAGYLIFRPSLIIGMSPNTTNDRPFNRILKNLDEGTPAVYDISWKFQPTYIGHLSEVIVRAVGGNIWGKTVAVAVPELKSRYDIAVDILTPLGIAVAPVDNHDATVVLQDNLSQLRFLAFEQYTYKAIIKKIVEEIRTRSTFVL